MFYILRRRGLGLGSSKAIKELSQHDITIVRNDKLPEFNEDDVILRWGCTSIALTPQLTITLNKRVAISIANKKSLFRKILQEMYQRLYQKHGLIILIQILHIHVYYAPPHMHKENI